ncbi:MAG: right-handed parallel beta-helix repeat-containing protein [Armatimonadetes bacterium]|nr:right-handed parallel beta-helix repeat-containing protein [Armatimonadota bacterium]
MTVHWTICGLLLVALGAAHAERTLYDDGWSGTLAAPNAARTDGPFATLARARDAIRALHPTGAPAEPITVRLRGGFYELPETLVFGPEDSGTAAAPVTWAAYRDETPILSGGRRVTGWQPAGAGLWQTTLPDVKAGRWSFRSLFAGGRRMVRARFPNVDPTEPHRRGFTYVAPPPGLITGVVGNIHNPGDWMDYAIRVPADGDYEVWVYYGHNMKTYQIDDMAGHTTLSVDGGEPVPLMNMPDTGSWGASRWARCAKLSLQAGDRMLRWQNQKGGGLGLAAFILVDDPAYEPAGLLPAEAAAGHHRIFIAAEKFTAFQGKQLSTGDLAGSGSKDTIPCQPGVIKPAWANAAGADVHIFPSDPNSCRAFKLIVQLAGVDLEQQTLRVTGKECIVASYPGDRFYVDNLRAELDAPDEWYADPATGVLTLCADKAPTDAVAAALGHIVRVDGDPKAGKLVTGLRFEGLTFAHNDWSLDDGDTGYGMGSQGTVHLVGARDCRVTGCTFTNIGKHAVAAVGCQDCSFDHNRIRNSAEGGILLLDTSHSTASDNDIEHIGEVYKHVGGVVIEGRSSSDNQVAHNRIVDSTRYGISIKSGGQRNVIEGNDLRLLSTETFDTGGIEVTQGDKNERSGSIIRGNRVVDVIGYSSRFDKAVAMCWGIYLDSYAGGYTVYDNLCVGNTHGGLMVQGGKDNQVYNNIFAESSLAQVWLANFQSNADGTVLHHNLIYTTDPKARLVSPGGFKPDQLSMDHNLYYQAGVDALGPANGELAALRKRGWDAESVLADPQFVDPEKGDYRLKPGSPAIALGFKPFDLSGVGPRAAPR